MKYEQARRLLHAQNQLHVLAFWDSLDASQREMLLADIGRVDWDVIREAPLQKSGPLESPAASDLTPPAAIRAASVAGAETSVQPRHESGERLLRENRVAALTVAGGQGTRLGFAGPKGALPITPVCNKSLFQHFAEGVLATNSRYECNVPWYIMTSPENHKATLAFFEEQDYFGLTRSRVAFFEQGTMPAFNFDRKLLLAERHRLALAPDGHGGVLRSLRRSGCLESMIREGREYISFFQIDNPLVSVLDPGFLGAALDYKCEAASKVVRKREEHEKAGVFVVHDGRLRVMEYSVFPKELAGQRNADGSLKFDLANIAAHVFSISFIDHLTRDESSFRLPWNPAQKRVSYVDLATGERIDPDQANAIKMEQFIFDAIAMARNPILYEVLREDEFSPIKNRSGLDSEQTAREDLSQRAVRWLEQSGMWPTGGDPHAAEISPLFALDAAELRSRPKSCPVVDANGRIYLGP